MEKKEENIRVRIAPSPTGPLHLGTVRTALFNWLFARQHNGSFILRIDDTDQERSSPEWEKDILEGLLWLGLNWDEGPILPEHLQENFKDQKSLNLQEGYIGNFGPYHQSQRIPIYQKYLKKLVEEKKAYLCFCRPEELEKEREIMIASGQAPKYSGRCRSLSEEEVKEKLNRKEKYVIRLKTPEKTIFIDDLIKGKISFNLSLIGDFIIAKDFSSPLYNFASVVDDYEMKISHVIRGDDHLSNTPKQIVIAEALNFPRPKYAHIPLLLNPDRTKLSKRKQSITLRDYKEKGYLPEALLNFLVLLGWHPEEEEEFLSLEEMIEKFSLKRIQKSPAIFLSKKLDWLNAKHIRNLSLEKLKKFAKPFLQKEFKEIDDNYLEKVLPLVKDRLKRLDQLPELTKFFFKKPVYSKNLLPWQKEPFSQTKNNLKKIKKLLEEIEDKDWQENVLEKELFSLADKVGKGEIFWPLRVALSGEKASPPPIELMLALGKKETIERIKKAIDKLEK